MSNFPPPPTYADPIIVDEITRRSQFNPLWFKWFLDLGTFVTTNGGGGLIRHNTLGALQGGSANEYYHLTTSQHGALTAGFTGTGLLVRQTTPAITDPTITQGRATQLDYTGYSLTPVGVPTTVGTVSWDDGNGTLQLTLKNGNVIYTLGQQEYVYCYNKSGTTLTKGQAVYISGAQGNRVAIKLAQADSDPNSANTIGFVAETIAVGAEGWVQSTGPIYKLNTFGYTAGATVYLSPTTPGAWTTTRPSAPNHTVILGFIERVSATVGSIYIKVDNGYELDELHNVKITSVQPNNLLQYDSTGPFWKNVAPSSITIGTATNLAGGAAGSVPYQSGASTTTFLGIGTAAQVLQVNAGATAPEWISSTGTGTVVRATSPTLVTPILGTATATEVLVTGTGGLGYGTGSGGVVTQVTSRTQGVTLDKTNGAITLVSAAGTTAWQSFTVTNNKVAATDTVIVNQKFGTDLYMIHVTNLAAGSFQITFATTGGTTTEQPVFNFAVIKAVTS
jgi:hypothetical protein